MNCPSCTKEITADSFFCMWCSDFVPSPDKGKKANVFARWVALVIDPLIPVALWGFAFLLSGVLASISETLGTLMVIVSFLFPAVYFVWFLSLLRQGLTPGKKLLGLQVVNHQTGEVPGFGKMFLREIVGRVISGLFLGLGYFWAIFDKNAQAWHDKLAGTVVLKVSR